MRTTASCFYILYTVFPQLMKSFFIFILSLGSHSTGALKSLEKPSFQFVFFRDSLKTLKMKAPKHLVFREKWIHVWASFYCKTQNVLQVGLWPFCLPVLILCFPHNPESTAHSGFSFFCFFPLKNYSCLSDKTAAEYFFFRASLRDCFDWQLSMADFLTGIIPLTVSLLWLFKSLFCPLSGFSFYAIRGVFFVCCWAGWLNVIECICQLISHSCFKSYSDSLYKRWARWVAWRNI